MTITAEEIEAKHAAAVDYYAPAAEKAEETEELFKAEYDIPRDQGDLANPASPRVLKPARPRAILDKHLTLLAVRATHRRQVVPLNTTREELEACSKIEHWLDGFEHRHHAEVGHSVWRNFVWWYLFRGRGCLEVRYDATLKEKGRLPIRVLADDPLCIFPMYGRHGLRYYTKEFTVAAGELRADIARHQKGARKNRWHNVELVGKDDRGEERAKADEELVTVVEYWDDENCAALVDGELLYAKPNAYGFIPLAEARCLDTPLDSAEWAYQSVLAPVADSLRAIFAIVSKLASGVDLFYYPTILVVYNDGRMETYDGGKIKLDEIPRADVKQVQVVNANPNQAVIQMLLGWLQGDVSLATLPDIAWGAEPSSLQSGFAISQVLSQVMDKIEDKKVNLEMAMGHSWGHVLKLVNKFGAASGTDLKVPAKVEIPYGAY